MTTLVIGACGQIGQTLLHSLAKEDELHAADITAPPPAVKHLAAWHLLDITQSDAVQALIQAIKPHRVIHLAAILSARGETMPAKTFEINLTGTLHVLEACRLAAVGQVLFASTIAVFGPGLPEPVGDHAPLHPRTMYGVTKVGGELLCEYYRERYGLDVRGVRFPGLVSAHNPGGGTSDYAVLMYTEGVSKGRYTAFCRADTRIPLMYMEDGITALLQLSKAPKSALTRCVYNIAGLSPTARDIAQSILARRPEIQLDFQPDPVRQAILDGWPQEMDDSLARRDFAWRPKFDLQSMTDAMLAELGAKDAEKTKIE